MSLTAVFLELCGERIENHFTSLGDFTLSDIAKKRKILREWDWSAKVHLTNASDSSFWCGAFVSEMKQIVVPWLWGKPGRSWEELAMKRLGARAHSMAGGGLVRDPGTIALAHIPIFVENQKDGDVDRDALIEKVVAVFTALKAEDIEVLARGSGEADGLPETEKLEANE